MSLLLSERKNHSQTTGLVAPARSRLFTELLDANHDAWRVLRDGDTWTFYREIGDGRAHLPHGSIVLSTGPGTPQTLDFFCSKGRRSLVVSYGDEVAAAAQCLMEREHAIALFNGIASRGTCQNWDHKLSFIGIEVSERCAELRAGTAIFKRLAGDAKAGAVLGSSAAATKIGMKQRLGLAVSQHENHSPFMECHITYPRPIQARFFSSRLAVGLEAITNPMAALVIEHNRNLEQRYGEFDGEGC
jgi:hypothetical protein